MEHTSLKSDNRQTFKDSFFKKSKIEEYNNNKLFIYPNKCVLLEYNK